MDNQLGVDYGDGSRNRLVQAFQEIHVEVGRVQWSAGPIIGIAVPVLGKCIGVVYAGECDRRPTVVLNDVPWKYGISYDSY